MELPDTLESPHKGQSGLRQLINAFFTRYRIGIDTHRLSKRAKDLGSAAVLVALAALVVTWLLIAGPVLLRFAQT